MYRKVVSLKYLFPSFPPPPAGCATGSRGPTSNSSLTGQFILHWTSSSSLLVPQFNIYHALIFTSWLQGSLGTLASFMTCVEAVPLLRQLVAGFPPRPPGFDLRSGHVEFVVDNVALGKVFS
jgi:ABC-type transport system involved in cytochrome c biogenesis permease subunit